jgi:type IX secretion system PorP/SprF family membrane protein
MNKVPEKETRKMKTGGLIIFIVMLCMKANAQFDPMFTQYMNNEMFINPAYTGTRDVIAATLLYRNQWAGIEGAPTTETFSIHSPIGEMCGAGISVMNENIGITHQLRINGNYSYRIKTSDEGHLSFGLQGGIINHRENMNELVLINQDDQVFMPTTPNVILPNAGFGMFYYTKRFYLGLSIPRMIKNSIRSEGSTGIRNSASPKDWHFYLTSAYVMNVSENFKFKPSIMFKQVYGAPVQGELSLQGLVKDFWWIGAAYRSGDGISATTGFQLTPQLRIFYSYDYALTPLQNYSSGSHEITIGYDFSFIKNKIASPRLF